MHDEFCCQEPELGKQLLTPTELMVYRMEHGCKAGAPPQPRLPADRKETLVKRILNSTAPQPETGLRARYQLREQHVGSLVQVAQCALDRSPIFESGTLTLLDEGIWTSSEDHDLATIVFRGAGLGDFAEGEEYVLEYSEADRPAVKALLLLSLFFGWSASLVSQDCSAGLAVDHDGRLSLYGDTEALSVLKDLLDFRLNPSSEAPVGDINEL